MSTLDLGVLQIVTHILAGPQNHHYVANMDHLCNLED
jgi:hypothetical protein